MTVSTSSTSPVQVSQSTFMTSSLRRFTVDEYHRLIAAEILTEDDAVELLEGWIVLKMSRNPPHDVCIELMGEALRSRLPAGWRLRTHCAITTDDSEPEPDFAVVRGDPRSRRARHPGWQELGLVVEVADSTLSRDRIDKARLYARAGIVLYWIVNLVERQVEVYSDPTGPDASPVYRRREDFKVGQAVPLILDGHEIARITVADLLP